MNDISIRQSNTEIQIFCVYDWKFNQNCTWNAHEIMQMILRINLKIINLYLPTAINIRREAIIQTSGTNKNSKTHV